MKSQAEKLYSKYSYLADIYANKLFSVGNYGLEKQDVAQELRIKVFKSIKTYGRTYAEYLRTGRYKPIKLEVYLKATLNNKIKDMIKKFIKEKEFHIDKISIQDKSFDVGDSYESQITANSFMIEGQDLCEGLRGKDKAIFIMFLKGWRIKELSSKFSNHPVEKIIQDQKKKMRGVLNRGINVETYYSYDLAIS